MIYQNWINNIELNKIGFVLYVSETVVTLDSLTVQILKFTIIFSNEFKSNFSTHIQCSVYP